MGFLHGAYLVKWVRVRADSISNRRGSAEDLLRKVKQRSLPARHNDGWALLPLELTDPTLSNPMRPSCHNKRRCDSFHDFSPATKSAANSTRGRALNARFSLELGMIIEISHSVADCRAPRRCLWGHLQDDADHGFHPRRPAMPNTAKICKPLSMMCVIGYRISFRGHTIPESRRRCSGRSGSCAALCHQFLYRPKRTAQVFQQPSVKRVASHEIRPKQTLPPSLLHISNTAPVNS